MSIYIVRDSVAATETSMSYTTEIPRHIWHWRLHGLSDFTIIVNRCTATVKPSSRDRQSMAILGPLLLQDDRQNPPGAVAKDTRAFESSMSVGNLEVVHVPQGYITRYHNF
jgi:hypothetical protein